MNTDISKCSKTKNVIMLNYDFTCSELPTFPFGFFSLINHYNHAPGQHSLYKACYDLFTTTLFIKETPEHIRDKQGGKKGF